MYEMLTAQTYGTGSRITVIGSSVPWLLERSGFVRVSVGEGVSSQHG